MVGQPLSDLDDRSLTRAESENIWVILDVFQKIQAAFVAEGEDTM